MKELLDRLTPADWIIIGVTMVSFIPLVIVTKKNKGKGQSFTTWFLWLILDTLQMFATIISGTGNWVILLGFAIGSLYMCKIMLRYRIVWDDTDTIISAITFFGICVWYRLGSESAIIAFTLTQLVASIPLARNIWQKPHLQGIALIAYIGFFIVNLLTLCTVCTTPEWTWISILYPGCFTIFEVMIICPIVHSIVKEEIKIRHHH